MPASTPLFGFDSVSAFGEVTSATSGQAIATIAAASLPAGFYRVSFSCAMFVTSGTPERSNLEIRKGATAVKRHVTIATATAAQPAQPDIFLEMDGSTAVSANAVGAATATAVYHVSLTATRIA